MEREEKDGVYEEAAELAEDEAKRVDVGDIGEEPKEAHDDVRDG